MILPLEVPVEPTPDEARQWLGAELGRHEYGRHLSALEAWLSRKFSEWFRDTPDLPDHAPNLVSAIFVAVLVVAIGWMLLRVRINPPGKRARSSEVMIDPTLSPAEYRQMATAELARGAVAQAVMAAFRAIVADLDRRTVLGDRKGRTAQEVAAAIGTVFPAHDRAIHAGADWFDAAAYDDGRRSTVEQVHQLLALGDQLAKTRPDFGRELTASTIPDDPTGLRP